MHAKYLLRRNQFLKHREEIIGSIIEVSYTYCGHIYLLTIEYFNFQLTEKSTNKNWRWTYVDPNLIIADQFPTVGGMSENPQPHTMKLLKEVDFRDRPGDL